MDSECAREHAGALLDTLTFSVFVLSPCSVPMVLNRTNVKLGEGVKVSRLLGGSREKLQQARSLPGPRMPAPLLRVVVGLHVGSRS